MTPIVQAHFILNKFSVSLVDNKYDQEGIEIFSKNFIIEFNKFDEMSETNPHVFSLVAKNEEFGVN